MILNIPSDMFLLFMIRMDEQMIDSILSDEETYMNMSREEFSKFISRSFSYHKLLCGDTSLLALQGTYKNGREQGYSFIGNHSRQRLDIIIAVNNKNEITHISSSPDFLFNNLDFANDIIPENLKQ